MTDTDSTTTNAIWVVKIGSSLLTNDGHGIDYKLIADWASQFATLREQGYKLLVVSSGAVAAGMHRLGLQKRPRALNELQATAATGQMDLVQAYEKHFNEYGMKGAQVLLTHDELRDRKRYLNARSTLKTLLQFDVIPIINENDAVANEELRFGDNDTLAALVANLVEAEYLIILTDQNGLYDDDPRTNPKAHLIQQAKACDPAIKKHAGTSTGNLGTGGMATKVQAAIKAARSGTRTRIVSGRLHQVLVKLASQENIGTLLEPDREPIAARKRWIASQLSVHGKLLVDHGAARVLQKEGRSLLAIGVLKIEGNFNRGDLVSISNETNQEIGRGLINYSSEETRKIIQHPSQHIEKILGYVNEPELIHRDNLVVL